MSLNAEIPLKSVKMMFIKVLIKPIQHELQVSFGFNRLFCLAAHRPRASHRARGGHWAL